VGEGRVKSRLAIFVAAAPLALFALSAGAQEAAPTLQEDPRAAKFKDVERGFFVGFDAGWLSFFETPVADPVSHPYAGEDGGMSGGILIGLNAGYDVLPRLAFSVFAVGSTQSADVDYGAFSIYAVGLDARYSFWSMKDRNGWERLFAYVHARGGYARTRPTGLFGDVETLLSAGAGIEYFTRLRHFSVGLAADGVYAAKAGALGWALYPTVRYTF
jgi:hypothetical protein